MKSTCVRNKQRKAPCTGRVAQEIDGLWMCFQACRIEAYEHESETWLRLGSAEATSNYPQPIFNASGIIRGLRSPLSAATSTAVKLHAQSHFFSISFYHHLNSLPLLMLTSQYFLNVLEPCPTSQPPEPGGRSPPVLSPETLGFSPRQRGSILPEYKLLLSQAPDVTSK